MDRERARNDPVARLVKGVARLLRERAREGGVEQLRRRPALEHAPWLDDGGVLVLAGEAHLAAGAIAVGGIAGGNARDKSTSGSFV